MRREPPRVPAHQLEQRPGDADGIEAVYLRDEEDGAIWSPCRWPAGGAGRYLVRHGFGYSVWEHQRAGIASEMTVFVPVDASARVVLLRLRNASGRSRRLSLAGYCELVLGELRSRTAPHLVTALDAQSGMLTAVNSVSSDFSGRTAVFACSLPGGSATGDRLEFIGRSGRLESPQALGRQRLSGRIGAALDPCFALMAPFELGEDEERELVLVLGVAPDLGQALALGRSLATPAAARRALEQVWQFWKRTLGVVHCETPEPAVNVLVNGWLLYQVLGSRMWARSGFYQSGGAYGFRDQLQDCLALLHARPDLVREQLLRAAAHQFVEGDVLHWWHPPVDRGVRTHFSDDYLWLPWAVARYIEATGDTGVLAQEVPYLEGAQLQGEEEARYELWPRSPQSGSLFDHCLRAVRHGLRFGVHGLPLMGCGDWNDGMNRVGIQGKGESVWLGFFLCDVLQRFSSVCARQGQPAIERELLEARRGLASRIEAEAWDGAWYRRAWFDDGTVLGSQASPECQIDSLPQSWAVLSGVAPPARAQQALDSAQQRLADRQLGLIKLFDPPFDRSTLDPGYIKGYVPGVRENGGQYTHAAIWLALAMAEAGDTEQAWELTRMLLPTSHTGSEQGLARYQAEPYVVAADVYAVEPHQGRGGWTWYTGSAGWLYRLLVEELLGARRKGGLLTITPRTPRAWGAWRMHYREGDTFYHLRLDPAGPGEAPGIELDGVRLAQDELALVDDQREHQVLVRYAGSPTAVAAS